MPTIIECIQEISKQFETAQLAYGHGTDNAWDEAVHLVLSVLGLPITSDDSVSNQKVSDEQYEKIISLAKERIQTRKPLPYLLKQAWFAGLLFYVDERVIIPRSPFGEWIERGFVPWANPEKITRILDIGTGSGCMAIAAALAFPKAKIDAVDIEKDALAVAKINVVNYALEDRVKLIRSDCFDKLNPANHQYDVIMSNPPYVSIEEMAGLPKEYAYEPKNALQASYSGLSIVIKILGQASQFLRTSGILVLEVGNTYLALQQRFPQVPFVWLEQERGGHGLLVLTVNELIQYKNQLLG